MTPAEIIAPPYPGVAHDATTRRADTWPTHKAKQRNKRASASALARQPERETSA